MSQPAPNSTPNQAAQAAAQAAQAAIQASKAKSQAAVATDAELNDESPAEADEQLAKAWGFSAKRPRISREALIGVVAIVALLAMFSYVVARHFQNRAQLAEKEKEEKEKEKEKVDPNLQGASNTDLFANNSNNLNNDLEDLEINSAKKTPKKRLAIDDETLDIGDGQSEPTASKVTTKKQQLPINIDDEFDTFGDDAKPTTKTRTLPRKTPEPLDVVEEEVVTPKTNRSTVTLDFDDKPEREPPALTKTTEPMRLKQPIATAPAEDVFEQPLQANTAKRSQDDFETVPKRARQPVRSAQRDLFTEKTGFDEPSSTTNLPPARPRAAAAKTAQHPLLREGEYLVESGDNFCVISKKLYGTEKYYRALAEHNRNRVADPCRMLPGLILAAPAKELLEQQHAELIPKAKPTAEAKEAKPHSTHKVSAEPLPSGVFYDKDGAPWYRVGKGDTLTGIAQAHLGRISRSEQIFNKNRDRLRNPDDLHLGQELRLPQDASQVRVVETGKNVR